MGGTDNKNNIVRVNLPMHAFLHRCLYEEHGKAQDHLAWRALSGAIGKEQIIKERQSLGSLKNKGRKHTEKARRNMSRASKQRTITHERLLILQKNASRMKEQGHTEQTKAKLKEIANNPIIKQKRSCFGIKNGMFGKKHDEVTLQKIQDKAINREKIRCHMCSKEMTISNFKRWNHGSACQKGQKVNG